MMSIHRHVYMKYVHPSLPISHGFVTRLSVCLFIYFSGG